MKLIALAALTASLLPAAEKTDIVFIGTYTRTASKGIYAYRFSPSTGKVTSLGLMAEVAHPSYLIAHPNHRFLYAVNEHAGANEPGDTVSAYSLNTQTGKLVFLNRVSSKGVGPCHLAIDKTGKILATANYGSGSVATFPIHSDGRLGEAISFIQHTGSSKDPVRQAGPHAHSVVISPDNRFLLTADLGLDRVFVYRLDQKTGKLEPNDPPFTAVAPGFGARHLAFHPNGKVVYLLSEIASKLTAFDYDAAHGTLRETKTVSALPAGFTGQSTTAEIQVDAAGKFVYVSNRGDDSIGVFTSDLTPVQHISTQGKTPRNFSLDPTGEYLFAANQNSASVVIYRVDKVLGKLTPTGQILNEAPEPSCVLFVPSK